MKRIGLFVVIVFFSAVSALAQPGGQGPRLSPEERAKRETEEIGKFVAYTEGQEAKVYDLLLANGKKLQELRGNVNYREMSESQRAEMRQKREAQQTETNNGLKKLFTADQYAKYEKYLQEQEQRRRERGPQGPPR